MILLFVLVAGVIFILDWQARQKRRREMSEWAAGRGMRFVSERDSYLADRAGSFRALQQGSNRYAFNTMIGRWGDRDFLGFDFHYETYSYGKHGRQTHHHYFSAVILSSLVPLKPMVIRPEGFFDKVAGFFGLEDINFESAEFSRRFHVWSSDRKWAFDVLHARAIQHMLDTPMFVVEFGPQAVIASRSKRFTMADFEAATALVAGLLDGLPEYLLKERGALIGSSEPRPAVYPGRSA